jgi:transposase
MMIQITIDKFNGYIRRIKEFWQSKSTHDEKRFAVKKIVSKISISNDVINEHVNDEVVIKTSSDFDIGIVSIKRDILNNMWKNLMKKIETHSES